MKQLKSLVALVLALSLTMTLVGSAFASDTSNLGAPYNGDTHSDTTFVGVADNSISVGGLEPGDQVKFYRVLDYDQDARGTLGTDTNAHGWKVVAPFLTGDGAVTAADLQAILTTGITSEMAGRIAKNATGDATWTATVGNGATVATQENPGPGLYVAIVVPANAGFTYNPIFVASDYYKTGDDSASSTWTAVAEALSYSDRAMAKKSPVTITKIASEPDASEPNYETDNAKAVAVGDTITYTITTTIPEFADNYTAPVFVISDKLSAGLTFGGKASVNVSFDLASGDTAPAYEIKDDIEGLSFKIVFTSAGLLNLSAATPVTITYTATVSETAITNVNEEDNTVTLEYSHNPDVTSEGNGKKLRDKTHHYTFTIDGAITGDSAYHWTEVVKVGLDKDGNEITQTKTLSSGKTVGALQGAEFKLYTDANCTTEYNKGPYGAATANANGNKILSDENGRLYIIGQEGISGLDAGTYYLREELAPEGYIRQQTAVKIEIIPTFFETYTFTETEGGVTYTIECDDVLQSYIVKIDDATTASYVLNYPDAVDGVRSTDEPTSVTGTDSSNKGDIVIGNSGPITTVAAEQDPADDDGKITNKRGVELPSTGGIGTTIFYVVGIVMVLGAAAVIFARRKAEQE